VPLSSTTPRDRLALFCSLTLLTRRPDFSEQVQGSVQLGALHARPPSGRARGPSRGDTRLRVRHLRLPPGARSSLDTTAKGGEREKQKNLLFAPFREFSSETVGALACARFPPRSAPDEYMPTPCGPPAGQNSSLRCLLLFLQPAPCTIARPTPLSLGYPLRSEDDITRNLYQSASGKRLWFDWCSKYKHCPSCL